MSVIAWSYEEENTFSMINYFLCRKKNGFSHQEFVSNIDINEIFKIAHHY